MLNRRGLGGLLATLGLSLSLSLLGCRGDGGTGGESKPSQPRAASTFTFVAHEPHTLDPVRLNDNSVTWTLFNIYQTLIRATPSGDRFEPALAETWTVSPEGTVYTFNLRKDAHFSDGTPVTSADVVFSLARVRDIKDQWQWLMRDVATVEAKDDHTVVITLKQPSAPFLAYMALITNGVISSRAFKDAPPEKIAQEPMGSGPYMVAEWKKGAFIRLKANPHYWKKGLPKTPEVKLVYVTDDNTRVLKLQSGEADGVDHPPAARIHELDASGKFVTTMDSWPSVGMVRLNTRSGPTANVDLRRALAYATDRETMVKVIMFGHARPATSFMPPNTLFFKKDLKAYTFDLEKAKEHLAKSGVKPGTRLEILVRAGDERRTMSATILKEMWGKLGLDVVLNLMDGPSVAKKLEDLDYHVNIAGWANDILDPSHLVEYSFSYKSSKSNFTGYDSPRMNELMAAGVREMDATKRERIYAEIQELAIEDAPLIWTYYTSLAYTMSQRVEGFSRATDGSWVLEDVVVHR